MGEVRQLVKGNLYLNPSYHWFRVFHVNLGLQSGAAKHRKKATQASEHGAAGATAVIGEQSDIIDIAADPLVGEESEQLDQVANSVKEAYGIRAATDPELTTNVFGEPLAEQEMVKVRVF